MIGVPSVMQRDMKVFQTGAFERRNIMNAHEKAVLLISATQNELTLGTNFYKKSTMQPLISVREILVALRNNNLIVEPIPKRQHIFRQASYGNNKKKNNNGC